MNTARMEGATAADDRTHSPEDTDDALREALDDAPPPEATTDDAAERVPFVDIRATGTDGVVQVRAGWLTGDGEVDALAISATVGVGQAYSLAEVALTWYTEQLRVLLDANGGGDGDA